MSDITYVTYSTHFEETWQHLICCHPTPYVTVQHVRSLQADAKSPHVCSEVQSGHAFCLDEYGEMRKKALT